MTSLHDNATGAMEHASDTRKHSLSVLDTDVTYLHSSNDLRHARECTNSRASRPEDHGVSRREYWRGAWLHTSRHLGLSRVLSPPQRTTSQSGPAPTLCLSSSLASSRCCDRVSMEVEWLQCLIAVLARTNRTSTFLVITRITLW